MTGCCAFGCSNSSEKGYLMKRFPMDPELRKIWAAKVKRENWTPTNSSMLCEIHFTPEMFEQNRADGRRLLKRNAVPTIFAHIPQKESRKPPSRRSPRKNPVCAAEPNIPQEEAVEVADGETSQPAVPLMASTSSSSSDEPLPTLLPRTKRKELKHRIAQYNCAYKKVLSKNKVLKNKLRTLKLKNKTVGDGDIHKNALLKVFNEDQINLLIKGGNTIWSNSSIKNALKLKFSCGSNGYGELLNQKFPLPSLRTLRRKVQSLNFKPGVLDDVFEFLKIKVDQFKDIRENDCCLILDEMSIKPERVFDNTSNSYTGYVTTSSQETLATHALVFMLAGVSSPWKQTVAYHFTGVSVSGDVILSLIRIIIEKASNIGLNVISITSDMGSANQSFWKIEGITAGRFAVTKNYIYSPSDTSKKVYVVADPVHLFKNIRPALLSNKVIELSDKIVQNNKLTCKYVHYDHLEELVKYQEKLNFKLCPKLHEEDPTPSHFQKMKVGHASHVISHSVSSGLKFLAEELNRPDYLSTAWFLDQVELWFKLITSRHPVFALCKKNEDAYRRAISFLKDFIDLFSEIKIGKERSFKPCQKGVLISTQSILHIQNYLLNERNYEFVLTGRFSQDCLENLFSLVRAKQPVPNALQFKTSLKLIMLSQYMKDLSKGSYFTDDREQPSDFLELLQNKPPNRQLEKKIICDLSSLNEIYLNNAELNSLYCISGYLISSIKKINKHCETCIGSIGGYSPYNLPYEKFTKMKSFNDKTLFFCNEQTFNYVLQLEKFFQNYIPLIESQQGDIKGFLIDKMKNISAVHIGSCHNLKKILLTRFVTIRLKIHAINKKLKRVNVFSSKSMHLYLREL